MKKTLLLMFMLASFAAFAFGADRTISGTVYDDSKQPLIGAAILVEGTDIATAADALGKYSITVPEGKTKLKFVYVGYIPLVVEIKNKNIIDVELKPDQAQLHEVVVTGYGTQKKASVTGAISTVTRQELSSPPAVQAPLMGKVAGIAIGGRDKQQENKVYRYAAPDRLNDESYANITENTFLDPKSNPLYPPWPPM